MSKEKPTDVASADGLGIAQADRQALEGESGKGAAAGVVKTRSGKVARDQHALSARVASRKPDQEQRLPRAFPKNGWT